MEGLQMKALIYCRTSSKSNRSLDNDRLSPEEKRDMSGKISLQLQERECRALAEKLDYDVAGVYSDNGKSCVTYPTGFESAAKSDVEWQATIEKMHLVGNEYRDGLGDMLKAIARGGIQAVIIRNETRLMRSLVLSALLPTVYGFLKKHNVIIHTVEGRKIDARNFQDVFLANIVSMTEINGMMERLRNSASSLKEKQDGGWLISGVLNYGFKQTGKQKIELVRDEMCEIRKMFDSFLAGSTLRSICKDLNTRKVKSKRAAFWRPSNVRSILRSMRVTGYQRDTNGKYLILQPMKEYAKELVSLDQWKATQTKLDNQKCMGRIKKIVHPLSTLMRCGCCGSAMVVQNGTSEYGDNERITGFYVCKDAMDRQNKGDCRFSRIKECSTHSTSGKFKSTGIVDSLMPLLGLAIVEKMQEAKDINLKTGRMELIDEELSIISNTRKTLASRISKGLISDNELDDMLAEQNTRKKELESERTVLESEINEVKEMTSFDRAKLMLALTEGKINMMMYRELAHKVFESITVYEDKVEIKLKHSHIETLKMKRGGIEAEKPNGGMLVLPRIRHTCARTLPAGFVNFYSDSVADVIYWLKSHYKGNMTEKMIYSDGALRVFTIGA
jgi:DNA invertase Pin-like site-specific DNA recombinase